MKFILLIPFLFLPGCQSKSKKPIFPKNCQVKCKSEFGQTLGSSPSGVQAYSNCSSDCVYFKPAFAEKNNKKVYTGIEWQCVEYARRWLLKNKNVVFPSLDYAFEIWSKTPNFKTPNKKDVPWMNHVNGSTRKPLVGDLLLYGKDFLGTGHVAVITKINKSHIFVAEQNYNNLKWASDYARKIQFTIKDNKFWVLDPYVLGWKSDRK